MLIDLRSDTVTVPTQGMLDAMMKAQVGDDVFGEDPTVTALEKKLARIFGKEAGLFCPSGTMSNQIAIRMHTQPGDEVICHKESHVYRYEGGGIAVNSGASIRLLDGERGRFTADDVNQNVNNANDVHLPLTRLVCVEDTANRGGGSIYDFEEIKRIGRACGKHGLALHLDGARAFNALVETKIAPTEYGKPFDSISICLSKGLGSPSGSVLLASESQIKKARRIRKVLGGGMRQAGYLAAAGIYALDHHVERLKEDHGRARLIGEIAKGCAFVREVFPVETNIVIFRIDAALSVDGLVQYLSQHKILVVPFGPSLVRMVTHLGVGDDALNAVREVLPKW